MQYRRHFGCHVTGHLFRPDDQYIGTERTGNIENFRAVTANRNRVEQAGSPSLIDGMGNQWFALEQAKILTWHALRPGARADGA